MKETELGNKFLKTFQEIEKVTKKIKVKIRIWDKGRDRIKGIP